MSYLTPVPKVKGAYKSTVSGICWINRELTSTEGQMGKLCHLSMPRAPTCKERLGKEKCFGNCWGLPKVMRCLCLVAGILPSHRMVVAAKVSSYQSTKGFSLQSSNVQRDGYRDRQLSGFGPNPILHQESQGTFPGLLVELMGYMQVWVGAQNFQVILCWVFLYFGDQQ